MDKSTGTLNKDQEPTEADTEVAKSDQGNQEGHQVSEPQSIAFAKRGVSTSQAFAGMMSALMSDILLGRVSPQVGNAVVNAGGKLLKITELQLKYGKPTHGADGEKNLVLLAEPDGVS